MWWHNLRCRHVFRSFQVFYVFWIQTELNCQTRWKVPLRVDGGVIQLVCQDGESYVFERWDKDANQVRLQSMNWYLCSSSASTVTESTFQLVRSTQFASAPVLATLSCYRTWTKQIKGFGMRIFTEESVAKLENMYVFETLVMKTNWFFRAKATINSFRPLVFALTIRATSWPFAQRRQESRLSALTVALCAM